MSKELLYQFNNKQTIDLGGRRRRFTRILSPNFKVFRDGNIVTHQNKHGEVSYLVSADYEGRVKGGNWEDVFSNLSKKSFEYEIETEFDLDLKEGKEVFEKEVQEVGIGGQLFTRIWKPEESLVFRKNGRIVLKLFNIGGFDSSGKPVNVKSISRLGNKVNIEFEKQIAILDPTWSDQPDGTDGKDAYIESGSPDTNYGGVTYLIAGGSDGYRWYIEFVNFENNIPEGATINSATVSFWEHDSGKQDGNSLFARRVTESWVEHDVTWNTPPADSTPQCAAASWAADPCVTDVKDIVEKICDETYANYGFLYKATATGNWGYFCSSDYGTAGMRPKIDIDYTSGGETYYETATESLKLSDSEAVKWTVQALLSDNVKLNETALIGKIMSATLAESLKLSSTGIVGMSYFDVLTEALKLGDSNAINMLFQLLLTENIKITDVLAIKTDWYPSLVESLKINDVTQGICTFDIVLTESLKFSDVLAGIRNIFATLTDSIKITDVSLVGCILSVELTENLKLSDVITGISTYFITINEQLKLSSIPIIYAVEFTFNIKDRKFVFEIKPKKMTFEKEQRDKIFTN